MRIGESRFVPNGASGVTFVPGRVFDTRSFASGGSGMVGTAGDYLKLLDALRTGGAPVLKADTVGCEAANACPARAWPTGA